MNICPFQPSDRKQLVTLWQDVFGEPVPHNHYAAAIDQKIAMQDDLLLVAETDSNVIGTVMGGYDGHRGWIYSLAVARSHRRTGVATVLLKAIEQALVHRGCRKINLQVRPGNAAAVALYESLGYAMEERISMGKRLLFDRAPGG